MHSLPRRLIALLLLLFVVSTGSKDLHDDDDTGVRVYAGIEEIFAHRRRGMHLTQARKHLARRLEHLVRRETKSRKSIATARHERDEDSTTSLLEIDQSTAVSKSVLATKLFTSAVKAYSLKTPGVHVCTSLAVDMSSAGIPGLLIDLAIRGDIAFDTCNECWVWDLRLKMGARWGFSVMGHGVFLEASAEGSVKISEQPCVDAPESVYCQHLTDVLPSFMTRVKNIRKKCHSGLPTDAVFSFLTLQSQALKERIHATRSKITGKLTETEESVQNAADAIRIDLDSYRDALQWADGASIAETFKQTAAATTTAEKAGGERLTVRCDAVRNLPGIDTMEWDAGKTIATEPYCEIIVKRRGDDKSTWRWTGPYAEGRDVTFGTRAQVTFVSDTSDSCFEVTIVIHEANLVRKDCAIGFTSEPLLVGKHCGGDDASDTVRSSIPLSVTAGAQSVVKSNVEKLKQLKGSAESCKDARWGPRNSESFGCWQYLDATDIPWSGCADGGGAQSCAPLTYAFRCPRIAEAHGRVCQSSDDSSFVPQLICAAPTVVVAASIRRRTDFGVKGRPLFGAGLTDEATKLVRATRSFVPKVRRFAERILVRITSTSVEDLAVGDYNDLAKSPRKAAAVARHIHRWSRDPTVLGGENQDSFVATTTEEDAEDAIGFEEDEAYVDHETEEDEGGSNSDNVVTNSGISAKNLVQKISDKGAKVYAYLANLPCANLPSDARDQRVLSPAKLLSATMVRMVRSCAASEKRDSCNKDTACRLVPQNRDIDGNGDNSTTCKPTAALQVHRNLATSLANLFVRVVGDVHALFNVYVYGDPEFDGQCEVANPSAGVFKETGASKTIGGHIPMLGKDVPHDRLSKGQRVPDASNPFCNYPWASKYLSPRWRAANFLGQDPPGETLVRPDGTVSGSGDENADTFSKIRSQLLCEIGRATARMKDQDRPMLLQFKSTKRQQFFAPPPQQVVTRNLVESEHAALLQLFVQIFPDFIAATRDAYESIGALLDDALVCAGAADPSGLDPSFWPFRQKDPDGTLETDNLGCDGSLYHFHSLSCGTGRASPESCPPNTMRDFARIERFVESTTRKLLDKLRVFLLRLRAQDTSDFDLTSQRSRQIRLFGASELLSADGIFAEKAMLEVGKAFSPEKLDERKKTLSTVLVTHAMRKYGRGAVPVPIKYQTELKFQVGAIVGSYRDLCDVKPSTGADASVSYRTYGTNFNDLVRRSLCASVRATPHWKITLGVSRCRGWTDSDLTKWNDGSQTDVEDESESAITIRVDVNGLVSVRPSSAFKRKKKSKRESSIIAAMQTTEKEEDDGDSESKDGGKSLQLNAVLTSTAMTVTKAVAKMFVKRKLNAFLNGADEYRCRADGKLYPCLNSTVGDGAKCKFSKFHCAKHCKPAFGSRGDDGERYECVLADTKMSSNTVAAATTAATAAGTAIATKIFGIVQRIATQSATKEDRALAKGLVKVAATTAVKKTSPLKIDAVDYRRIKFGLIFSKKISEKSEWDMRFDVRYESVRQGTLSIDFPGAASVRVGSGVSMTRDLSDLTAGIVYVLTDYLPSSLRRRKKSKKKEECDAFELCTAEVDKLHLHNRSAVGYVCGTSDGRFEVKFRESVGESQSPLVADTRVCFDDYEVTCRARLRIDTDDATTTAATKKKKKKKGTKCPRGSAPCERGKPECCCMANYELSKNKTHCEMLAQCAPIDPSECAAIDQQDGRYTCEPAAWCRRPRLTSEELEQNGGLIGNILSDLGTFGKLKAKTCELRDADEVEGLPVASSVQLCGTVLRTIPDRHEIEVKIEDGGGMRTIPMSLPSLERDMLEEAKCEDGGAVIRSILDCSSLVTKGGDAREAKKGPGGGMRRTKSMPWRMRFRRGGDVLLHQGP